MNLGYRYTQYMDMSRHEMLESLAKLCKETLELNAERAEAMYNKTHYPDEKILRSHELRMEKAIWADVYYINFVRKELQDDDTTYRSGLVDC